MVIVSRHLQLVVRFSSKDRGRFYADLSKYTRAGIGIDKACESIKTQPGNSTARRSVCEIILNGLQAGHSVAGALRDARRGPKISEMEVSVIDAAERGGVLELGFQHLAEHYRQEDEARRRIRKALVYPVILLHFALLVGIGITALLENVSPNAEPGTGVQRVKQGLFWVLIGYALAILIFSFLKRLASQANTSAAADALFRRIPLFGSARRNQALARFCEVFRISLLAGLKMDQAWEGSGKASQSGVIRETSARGARRLAAGESLADVVLTSLDAFPGDLARSLASADEAGQLDRDAAHWADYYREAAAESVERLAEWAPKIFYWFVLGIAAWMVLRVAFSYFGMINGMREEMFDF